MSAVRESVVVSAAQVDVPLSTTSSSVTDPDRRKISPALQVRRSCRRAAAGAWPVDRRGGGLGAQTSAFPRGGESDYSLVFIDGVQANAFGGGFDFAHTFRSMNIERIEIVRGPQSALYGFERHRIGHPRSCRSAAARRGVGARRGRKLRDVALWRRRIGQCAGPWHWGASVDRLASDGVVENDDYERLVARRAAWMVRAERSGHARRRALHR